MLPEFPDDRAQKRKFLLDAVESVRRIVSAGTDESERIGALPIASVDAIRGAGLFALKLPRPLGGAEADPVTQIEVIEALSYIDAAAGWCLMIGATAVGQPGAYAPDEAIAEIFPNGYIPLGATSTAPMGKATPVDGGYTLSGRWPFASGVRHAEWMSAGAIIPAADPNKPPISLALVYPTASARIHDNWQVFGLEGTGSNDISVENIFVPQAFTWDSLAFQPKRGGAIYRMGRPGFVANEHAAFALGVAQRALDEIIAFAPAKRRGRPPTSVADRGAFRLDIAECDFRLRAARMLSHDVFERAYAVACQGRIPDAAAQAEMRGVSAYTTRVALDVVTTAFRYAGGEAIFHSSPLQRCLRNINAAAQHLNPSGIALEHHGAALLNLPDVNPMA